MNPIFPLKKLILPALIWGFVGVVWGQDSAKFQKEIVFDNQNSEVPYRIPAIAKNRKGDLITVADYRYTKADIGVVKNGKLDLRYRIKDGKTGEWSDIGILAKARGEGDNNIAFGDPCIVADRESDKIMVTSCVGNVSFPKGTHVNHQGWARFYSEDGGKTWSDFEDISEQVFSQLDKRSDGNIRCFFIGSGKIEQSPTVKVGDYYRLYCAALVRTNDGKNVNYAFYSDDFGKNWNLLGEVEDFPIPIGADEPKIQELPDGNILISSRVSGGRLFNIFTFSDIANCKGKWGDRAKSDFTVKGVIGSDDPCNGEVLCLPVTRNSDKEEMFLLLQSVPLSQRGEREQVGINYKELASPDDYSNPARLAADWDGVVEITPISSAYSTMTIDKDNNIAFFTEENYKDGGYDLVLYTMPIEKLTNGKYSYRQSTKNKSKS